MNKITDKLRKIERVLINRQPDKLDDALAMVRELLKDAAPVGLYAMLTDDQKAKALSEDADLSFGLDEFRRGAQKRDFAATLSAFTVVKAALQPAPVEPMPQRLREAIEGVVHFRDGVAHHHGPLARELCRWIDEMQAAYQESQQ